MLSGDRLFQQFLRERTYRKNVTRKTIVSYESAWKAYKGALVQGEGWPVTRPALQQLVVTLRQRGRSAKAARDYWHWCPDAVEREGVRAYGGSGATVLREMSFHAPGQ